MQTDYQTQINQLTTVRDDLNSRINTLQTKLTAFNTLVASNTVAVRQATAALHGILCPLPHDNGVNSCTWHRQINSDDPNLADWTEPAHSLWLGRIQNGIGKLREIGFTVTEPAPPAP